MSPIIAIGVVRKFISYLLFLDALSVCLCYLLIFAIFAGSDDAVEYSETDLRESEDKYCESSTSDEEFQDYQKYCSDAVISSTSKSPYEMLRDNNIARNSKELSRIFGLPESKTGIQPTKRNCVGKTKTKKKNSVQ